MSRWPFFLQRLRAIRPYHPTHLVQAIHRRMVLRLTQKRSWPAWPEWKLLPRFLSRQEKRAALGALILFSLSALFLVGRFFTLHQQLVPATGGEYTEALVGTPEFINPLYASRNDVDQDLASLIFSGLLKPDGHGGLVNDLTESFTISEDGKTYAFVLRPNARWHDGEPVTAHDVATTIAMVQNPEFKSPLRPSFSHARVQTPDDRTIQFILEEPFTPFLSALTLGILPAHVWEDIAPKNALLADANLKPIGSGPYRFESFRKDGAGVIQTFRLQRATTHHEAVPFLDRLTFRFYPNSQSALDAFLQHHVQGVGLIPQESVAHVKGRSHITVWSSALAQYRLVVFHLSSSSPLQEKALRQALGFAVSSRTLIESVLGGNGNSLSSVFLPTQIGFFPPTEEQNIPAVDRGKKILEDAGWTLKEGTEIREKTTGELTTPLHFTLTTVDHPEWRAVAEELQKAWRALGADATIEIVGQDVFQRKIFSERTFDAALFTIQTGLDPDPFPFWHSSQTETPGLNVAGWKNAEADAALVQGRSVIPSSERQVAYASFAKIFADELPGMALFQPRYFFATQDRVQGINVSFLSTPSDRFANVEEWYLKTKRVWKK